MGFFVASLLFAGLMVVSMSIDKVAKEMKRANQLKEAELRERGVALDVDQQRPD